MALPRFKNLRVFHCDGFDPDMVLQKVNDFLAHPDHKNFKYINSHVDYFRPNTPQFQSEPEKDFWVEVTILYQE